MTHPFVFSSRWFRSYHPGFRNNPGSLLSWTCIITSESHEIPWYWLLYHLGMPQPLDPTPPYCLGHYHDGQPIPDPCFVIIIP